MSRWDQSIESEDLVSYHKQIQCCLKQGMLKLNKKIICEYSITSKTSLELGHYLSEIVGDNSWYLMTSW